MCQEQTFQQGILYPRFELVDEFRETTKGKSFHIVSLSTLLEIFDTDSEIKDSHKQAKASFDPDDEYRKYLNIPIEHGLITNHINWNIKGVYDTDTYLILEVDRAGNIINKYNFSIVLEPRPHLVVNFMRKKYKNCGTDSPLQ